MSRENIDATASTLSPVSITMILLVVIVVLGWLFYARWTNQIGGSVLSKASPFVLYRGNICLPKTESESCLFPLDSGSDFLVPSIFCDLPIGECTPGCYHLGYNDSSLRPSTLGAQMSTVHAHGANLEQQSLLISLSATDNTGGYVSIV